MLYSKVNLVKNIVFCIFLAAMFFALSLNKSVAQQEIINNLQGPDIKQPIKQRITITNSRDNVQDSKYIIEPGDVISFSVYDEPDFDQADIKVRTDGYATIAPLGEIYVAGSDIKNLTKILKVKMAVYIRNPQISIGIVEFHLNDVHIYGAVQKPGIYQQINDVKELTQNNNLMVKADFTISNIIANAGGVTPDADLTAIRIIRNTNEVKEVNLWKLINDGDVSQNLMLKSGDEIYVPTRQEAILNDEDFKILAKSELFPDHFPVRVIGEVQQAGVYDIESKSPYLNSAIAMSEGYTLGANKKTLKY